MTGKKNRARISRRLQLQLVRAHLFHTISCPSRGGAEGGGSAPVPIVGKSCTKSGGRFISIRRGSIPHCMPLHGGLRHKQWGPCKSIKAPCRSSHAVKAPKPAGLTHFTDKSVNKCQSKLAKLNVCLTRENADCAAQLTPKFL
jgi:hypothetical protein